MRKLMSCTAAAIAATAVVVASPASAQTPAQDTVTGSALNGFLPPEGPGSGTAIVSFDARSGPSGEAPTGSYSYYVCAFALNTRYCEHGGRVTCMRVQDNRAVIGYYGTIAFPLTGPFRVRGFVEVVDNGSPGAGRDTLKVEEHPVSLFQPPQLGTVPAPDVPLTDCPASLTGGQAETIPTLPNTEPYSFAAGRQDFVVHDAKAFPTSKDQCKNGGWRGYGQFKNEGDCVAYVATRGRNEPGQNQPRSP